jgi:hypothetical protein
MLSEPVPLLQQQRGYLEWLPNASEAAAQASRAQELRSEEHRHKRQVSEEEEEEAVELQQVPPLSSVGIA